MIAAPLFALMLPAAPAAAKPAKRDDIVVVGERPRDGCVGIGAGGERRLKLDCLNRSLAAGGGVPKSPDQDASAAAGRQPPSRTGTFSFTATAQRMGNTFGKSAQPQRPAAPVFAPIGDHR